MALTPRSGSSITQSDPNVIPNDIPNTQSDIIADMPFVTDAALNKYAIDTTQYANTTKQLVGFMKGKRVLVTYYRLLRGEGTNNRTNIADLPTARNVIDTEYQKIMNLEITLQKGFEFTANNGQANMSIKGQAWFYPNMNPNIGDIFTMGTGDGRIGLCRVSSVTPNSWRQDRTYVADFIVQEFLDAGTVAPIEGSVTLVSVFSKENYLGGTAALLSEQTYTQLLQIKEMRRNLCRFYHQSFFDRNLCSYVVPDGTYDPWAVHFMSNKLTMEDIPIRPKNLFTGVTDDYQKTLWGRLEDRFNNTLYGVFPYMSLSGYNETRMGVFVSELYGRSILFPSADPYVGSPYIYTMNFYTNNIAAMTAEEQLIYNAILLRDAGDLTTFITNYLDTVFALSVNDQYYKIPIYIHLIDMCLQSKYREIDAPSMNFASTEGL